MFYVTLLLIKIYLELIIQFNGPFINHFHTVNSLFSCIFLIFPFFPYHSIWLNLPSQQQCLLCNFQPHLVRGLQDSLINMLHTCNCLLPFNFWTVFDNNFTRAQCALPGYVFHPIFQCKRLITCHTQRPILFQGGSSSCDFLNFICTIYITFFFFKCYMSSC